MTRPIKFRAWDDKEKKWLLGYELPNLGGFNIDGETVLLGEWSRVLDMFLFHEEGRSHDDLKIMQFTGLLDKNGKEIYEGDIVKNDFNSVTLPSPMKVVSLWDLFTRFGIYREMYGNFPKAERLEIIGNIYETPELLNSK